MTLRFEVRPSDEEIAAGVARIRRWRRAYWMTLGIGLPVALVLWTILDHYTNGWVAAIPLVLEGCGLFVTTAQANGIACPRCGKTFWTVGSVYLPWNNECLWCGLRLDPPKSDD